MKQDNCEKCLVPGEVQDIGTASGRKTFRCPTCSRTWREKSPLAMALGALGGRARAERLSPEELSRQGESAANARWRKVKNA